MLRKRSNVRFAAAALIGVVALAAIGSLAARGIRSPAQIAADTAAPAASRISVPVERRALATEVIVRGTVRFGAPQEVTLPVSALKTSTSVVSRVPRPGARLDEGAQALLVSGRPVFVLRGATPMHRDLGPGSEGGDVRQLEQALARAGLRPGSVDGRYDGATASAVASMYVRHDEEPFGPTDAQADQLRTAAAAAAAARDAQLQTRLALRTAAQGATPADVNQARVDASAAAELIPPARGAVTAALDKADTARAAIRAAELQTVEAGATAGGPMALADADVINKRAAVNDALEAQAEAQRRLASTPPDTPPDELETLRAAVRGAIDKVGVTRADLTAAGRAAETARAAPLVAVAKADNDGWLAGRQLALAAAEARGARAALAIAQRKLALARARVRIIRRPPDTALERRIVASSQTEAARTQAELSRLALRTGVQVPADEVLFFPSLPVRVDTLAVKRGSQLAGSVMTVTNSRLAIDSSLSVSDAKLVRHGLRVRIEEPDLGVRIDGRVSRLADKPGTMTTDLSGTTPVDPARTYVEVLPSSAPPSLVGASVKLSIAVKGTKGKVMAVPIAALSVAADGSSRVQVDLGGGKTRFVGVVPGLAAQGFVAVTPTAKGKLGAGDLVVVGAGPSAAGKAPTGVGSDPSPSPGGATATVEPAATPQPGATTAPSSTVAPAPPAPGAPGGP